MDLGLRGFGFRVLNLGVVDLGFRGPGCRVRDQGFWIWDSGAFDLRFGGLGFEVKGFWIQKGLPWGLGFCIPTIFLILLIVIRPSGFLHT